MIFSIKKSVGDLNLRTTLVFWIKNKRNFLGKSSPRSNRDPVPQVSTPTYFVPKTCKNFWENHLQGQIGTPCRSCQPRPILNQKQAKLPGEIISKDQPAHHPSGVNPNLFCTKTSKTFWEIISRDSLVFCAPGVDPNPFCTRNNWNFLEEWSPGTNRHTIPQV